MALTEQTAGVALAAIQLVRAVLAPGSSQDVVAGAARVVIDFRELAVVIYSPDGAGDMRAQVAFKIDPNDPASFGVPGMPVCASMLVTDGKCH